MNKKIEEYYMGLDIGTNSVGWAVTDPEYKVCKFNRKAMWGIRLFEAGKTAEERRLHRSSRRLNQRKVQRIKLLQEFFSESISKEDFTFFLKMNESKYHPEEKKTESRFNLFNDEDYTDVDFHKQYKTIYHLRYELIKNPEKHDLRLYYLALHHILKHRGHFLFEGSSFNLENSESVIVDILKEVIKNFNETFGTTLNERVDKEVLELIKDKSKTINDRKKEIVSLMINNQKDKQGKAFCHVLVDADVKLSDLFADPELNEMDIKKIKFSNANFDEQRLQLEDILGENVTYIDQLKLVYDWGILSTLLKGKNFIAEAKIESWEKHQKDLKILKSVVRKYLDDQQYREIFVQNIADNYCSYIGKVIENKKEISIKKCGQLEFGKFIEKKLNQIDVEDEDITYLKNEINAGNIMPKQRSNENSVIPYQIHLTELQDILKNASKHYPFLTEKDQNGTSVAKKIEQIFKFRIPYYIGPLNDAHKGMKGSNCWIVKKTGKETEKIRPWNFEDVVDTEQSAENFILRMTNKCTYLIGEDVLPKNSLLYSEFMVLNELNNLKIDGRRIHPSLKIAIFENVFKKTKRVTQKRVKKYLETEGIKINEISGIDGDFKSSLGSYIDIKNRIGDKFQDVEMVENLIKWIVLFGEDKKLLKSKITENYSDKLTENEIKMITGLTYKGWGRLSKKFLTGICHKERSSGNSISIIHMMKNEPKNLMELLSNEYDYLKNIDIFNNKLLPKNVKLDYELVEDLYVSPAVKRSIWQTLQIVEENRKIMKAAPKKIFVEVARNPEEIKKRKFSRRKTLTDLYKQLKNETRDWVGELESKTDAELRRDRLYLYYTQMGRCMYTNKQIDIGRLYDNQLYDIDHIYPQSKTKDDSLDNRVLVLRESNANKTDKYPLDIETQNKNSVYWKILLNKGFISRRKYDRLTRKEPLTENELSDFIARQLVETRQSTKAVTRLLKTLYPDTTIVYVKANHVSDFRHKYDLLKCRELNDFHHARDAYLNIVVGNVYHTKFTSNPVNFIRSGKKYSMNRMYDFDVERNGMIAWEKDRTISKVKKQMEKNNILFTRYTYTGKGELFDLQPVKAGKAQIPLKGSDERLRDLEKYGGYNKAKGAYFFFVEHLKGKKQIKSIEFVPVHIAELVKTLKELKEYCETALELQSVRILIPKIKLDSLFEVDGMKLHLSGRTGNRLLFKNAVQLILSEKQSDYLRCIYTFLKKAKENPSYIEKPYENLTKKLNNTLYENFINKLENKPYNVKLKLQAKTLKEKQLDFESLDNYEQCKLLSEINHCFQCNSVYTNLKALNGPATTGIILLQKVFSTNGKRKHEISIINQSITGLFEQKVDLKKL